MRPLLATRWILLAVLIAFDGVTAPALASPQLGCCTYTPSGGGTRCVNSKKSECVKRFSGNFNILRICKGRKCAKPPACPGHTCSVFGVSPPLEQIPSEMELSFSAGSACDFTPFGLVGDVNLGNVPIDVAVGGSLSLLLDLTEDPNVGRFSVLDSSQLLIGDDQSFVSNGVLVQKTGMEILFQDVLWDFEARGPNVFGEFTLKIDFLLAETIPFSIYEHGQLQATYDPESGHWSDGILVSGTSASSLPQPSGLEVVGKAAQVALNWSDSTNAAVVAYEVSRADAADGPYQPIATVTESSFDDTEIDPSRSYFYVVRASDSEGNLADPTIEVEGQAAAVPFVRGDCDGSGEVELTDGIELLNALFIRRVELPCRAACDFSGSASLGITTAVYLFEYLFLGGSPPPTPFPSCGEAAGGQSPQLACAVYPLCATPAGGFVSGTVLGDVFDDFGIEVSLAPMEGVEIVITNLETEAEQRVSTDAEGEYLLGGLPQGGYEVRAETADGFSGYIETEVALDKATTVHFTVNPRTDEVVFPSLAAVAVNTSVGQVSPDTNSNGWIDLEDLATIRAAEDVDPALVEMAEGFFGRSVIRLPGSYEAMMSNGGTIFRLGDTKLSGQSQGGGFVRGDLFWAASPTRVLFEATFDQGTLDVPELGPVDMEPLEGSPTSFFVDLNTGRIEDGHVGLFLRGQKVPFGVGIEMDIADGVVSLAPHGFRRYHVVGITGTLAAETPLYGGLFVTASQGDDPKPNDITNCRGSVGRCPAPATKDGFPCRANSVGLTCAIAGRCGTCQTRIRPPIGDCECDCQ